VNRRSQTQSHRARLFSFIGPLLLIACWLSMGFGAAQAQSDTLKLRSDIPLTYVVQKGDTLWDISAIFLEEPWRWPELWNTNPGIDNPHLIFPGDVLTLRWQDGRPQLVSTKGDVRLSPKVRSEPVDTAIPPIPREQIDPFLKRNRVLSAGTYEELAYLIAGNAGRLLSGLGDQVYGRGPVSGVDKTYSIIRKAGAIVDPITGEFLGQSATDIGTVSLQTPSKPTLEAGAVKTFEVTRITEEVRIGDRLLPAEEGVVDAYFQPRAPAVEIENGFMIAVDGGVTQIGQMNIVTINRGAREGLVTGDVLAIYQTGATVIDPVKGDKVTLPDVRAGVLMVFSVYEKASFGLVLWADRPLAVGDKVKNP